MIKDLYYQNAEYLDSDLTNVFHFLELSSSHSFLIGSANIRNIKYAVDYDLNQDLKINDTVQILNHLHQEFLSIFDKAYKQENYYVVDFKCGYKDDEPIRWNYTDLKNGYSYIDKIKFTFQECLVMPDNIIKIDIVYLYHGIFTDINILYNLHIVAKREHLHREKKKISLNMVDSVKDDIKELITEGKYFKVIKRLFTLSILEKHVDKDLIKLLNSDYGAFYKFINCLALVVVMMDQTFKPVPVELIKSNLEYFKQFGSHILMEGVNLDNLLNKLVKVIDSPNKGKLELLIKECEKILNNEIKKIM